MNLFNTYLLLTIYDTFQYVLGVGVFLFIAISVAFGIAHIMYNSDGFREGCDDKESLDACRIKLKKFFTSILYKVGLFFVFIWIISPSKETVATLIALRHVDKGIEYSLTSLEEYKSINPESMLKDDAVWSTIDNILKTLNEGE